MSAHIINGQFQSDKYPTCPPGKVPLSVKDPTAQDLLWEYAQRRRQVDAEFADDLEQALYTAGFEPQRLPKEGLRLEDIKAGDVLVVETTGSLTCVNVGDQITVGIRPFLGDPLRNEYYFVCGHGEQYALVNVLKHFRRSN